MSTRISTQVPPKQDETGNYTIPFLARVSNLIKESIQISEELERLLHNLVKLSLTLVFAVVVGIVLYHALALMAGLLFHK